MNKNQKEILNVLQVELKKVLKDEEHYKNIIDNLKCIMEFLGYKIEQLYKHDIMKTVPSSLGEWVDDGKYSYINDYVFLKINDEIFVLKISQCRSGSYFSDYYYQEANFTLNHISKMEMPVISSYTSGVNKIVFYADNSVSINGKKLSEEEFLQKVL